MGLFSVFLGFHKFATLYLLGINGLLCLISLVQSVQSGGAPAYSQVTIGFIILFLVIWYLLLFSYVYSAALWERLWTHSGRKERFLKYSAALLVLFLIGWLSLGSVIGLNYYGYITGIACLAQMVFTANLVMPFAIEDYMIQERPVLRSAGEAIQQLLSWSDTEQGMELPLRKAEEIAQVRRETGRLQLHKTKGDPTQEHQGAFGEYVYAPRETTQAQPSKTSQKLPSEQEEHGEALLSQTSSRPGDRCMQPLSHFLRCGCCLDATLTVSRRTQGEAGSTWEEERRKFCSMPPVELVNGYVPSGYEDFKLHQLCPKCAQVCQEHDYALRREGRGKQQNHMSLEGKYLRFRHHDTPEMLRDSAETCHLCYLIWDTLNSDQKATLLKADAKLVETWRSQQLDPGSLDQLRFIRIVITDEMLIPHFNGLKRPRRWHKPVRGFENMLPEVGSEFARPLRLDIPRVNYDSGPIVLPISTNTGSSASMRLVENFFKNQQDGRHHDRDISELPTRMINVSQVGSGRVYLEPRRRILANWADEDRQPQYVALSHCWGEKVFRTLTLENAAEFERDIAVSSLPRSFQEAMQATHELGIEHIWIDSLCIIQDSSQDWEREAAQMANVYSNAKYTFVAASAWDGSEGLFRPQDPRAASPCLIGFWYSENESYPMYVVPQRQSEAAVFEVEVLLSRWNQRAWCFQERYLSTSTVYFGETQIFMSSGQNLSRQGDKDIRGQFSSDFIWQTTEAQVPRKNSRMKRPRDETPENIKQHQDWHERWWHMVHDYSRRDITKLSDKLPALAGLAEFFERTAVRDSDAGRRYSPESEDFMVPMPSEYIFGLWRHLIAADLLWYVDSDIRRRRPAAYRAPTWSWASLDSVIFNDLAHFKHGSCGLEIICVDSNDEDPTSLRGSTARRSIVAAVLGAKLTVRGELRAAGWRRSEPSQRMYFAAKSLVSLREHEIHDKADVTGLFSPVSANPAVGPLCHELLHPETGELIGWVVPDTEEDIPAEVFCLKVALKPSTIDGLKTPSMIRGLVLSAAPEGGNHYLRVGFFELISEFAGIVTVLDSIPPEMPGHNSSLGRSTLRERVSEVEWRLDPHDFFSPASEKQTIVLL